MSELTRQLAAELPQRAGPGPEWARALRETAAGQFREHGLPTRRDETWKYTNLRALEQRGMLLPAQDDVPAAQSSQAKSLLDSAYQVDMLDGRLANQRGQLPNGLT